MNELRRDYVRNRWVSISSALGWKPKDFPVMKISASSPQSGFCPFCEGNEEVTPPEIAAFRQEQSEPNGPGWLVRAIPNKFTAFSMEGSLEERKDGVFHRYNGLGQHEVVIETPRHDIDFHDLETKNMEMTIAMFRLRYNDLAKDQRIKYVQIYKNRGMFAGASLGHCHSQIIGLPFAPQENIGLTQYYKEHRECLICTMLKQELDAEERIVYQDEHFVVLCPYASRFAYETWIVPKRHTEHFGQVNEEEEKGLAVLCKRVSLAIVKGLDNVSYNFVINTAPVNSPYEPGYHWYMEFTPRLLVAHGFEIATGIYMNLVPPETAAPVLREALKEC
ncbi:MAG: DUF4931 domain-containing protein [Syntrophothermus sp.]|uniref:galactose-1-phosphate uridylyltransferase n=1 Tax=Syntrophothermus sp. TaxID=2736299 RepID=UPI00257C898C|nr:DUF4931 domain-containing protein [Syntrophothermus sp.]NSW82807.1 DUF4931 domain-containing protein [Syntrophothermus sp.]